MAEIVRGGLQSVPRAQTEAAQALGPLAFQDDALIVLPQALRAVIPALVGQFISLFKDTSLVFVIGLVELLAVAGAASRAAGVPGAGAHRRDARLRGVRVLGAGHTGCRERASGSKRRLGVGER